MITEFQGQYRWLSNFAASVIKYQGGIYRSVEHAYQSAKSDDPGWKLLCLTTDKPGDVKRASREITPKEGWDEIKVEVMRDLLEKKYAKPFYRSLLMSTDDMEIQEGNWWGDKFWGVCLKTGEGENRLGKMIMEIRKQLNSD